MWSHDIKQENWSITSSHSFPGTPRMDTLKRQRDRNMVSDKMLFTDFFVVALDVLDYACVSIKVRRSTKHRKQNVKVEDISNEAGALWWRARHTTFWQTNQYGRTEWSLIAVACSVGVIHGGIIFFLMPQWGMNSGLDALHSVWCISVRGRKS